MPRIGDKRTEAEVRADLEKSRELRMKNAAALVYDLADAGFNNLWMEVTQITGHGDFWVRIIMDEVGIHNERFETAMTIANAHGAKVYIDEVHMNQMNFSRLAFWPASDD